MSFVLGDRVQETSTTTGTGALTLAGAVLSFATFAAAIGAGNDTYYTITNPGTGEWEVGVGAVGSGTLTRTTVLKSSNADAAVNFTAGTKNVFCTLPAAGLTASGGANKIPMFDSTGTLALTKASGTVASFRGTTAANSQTIVGNTAGDFVSRVLSTGDVNLYSDVGKYFDLGSNGTPGRIRIHSGGRIGINQTTDDGVNQLQITGTTYMSDRLSVGTTNTTAGQVIAFKTQAAFTSVTVGNLGTTGPTTGVQFLLSEDLSSTQGYLRRYRDGSGLVEIGFTDALNFKGAVNGTPVDRLNISSVGNVGLGGAAVAGRILNIGNTMTGATTAQAVRAQNEVQSDVTAEARGFFTSLSTQAASFTLGALAHYTANQSTIGAGSTVTSQIGFNANSTLAGAGTNIGFQGALAAAANNWNLYMAGTAKNYLAGSLLIGSTTDDGVNKLQVTGNTRLTGALGVGGDPAGALSILNRRNITGGTAAWGMLSDGVIQSGVTGSARIYASNAATAAASFTLSSLQHFRAEQSTIGAGSTVSEQIGFYVTSTLTGAGSNYGFRGAIAAGSNRFNIYMDGTADNYLAGSLGIGAVPAAGRTLLISKNITGGINSSVIRSDGVVQSDVTSNARIFHSLPSTAAATFTLANLYHFHAEQSSVGAASAITNQYGFYIDATLVGATNNYGIYANIPAAANRFNIYAAGTAANYFAGELGIGAAPSSSVQLLVAAATTSKSSIRIPHGAAPTSPVDGDVWTTTAGMFIRINGVTKTVTLT